MGKLQSTNLGIFLVRLALAAVFIGHGVSKFLNLGSTVAFFGKLGLPEIAAYLVAAVETSGGLAMLFGVWTNIAGVLLAGVMVGAIVFTKSSKGIVWMASEFEFTLLMAALGIAFAGPGSWSLGRGKTAPSPATSATPPIPPPKQIT